MLKTGSESERGRVLEALTAMKLALRLLDEVDAPPDIGAHLDLAICRLENEFGMPASPSEPVTLPQPQAPLR